MATVNINAAVNMFNYRVWYGVVDSYDSGQITIRAGGLTGQYKGNFSYDTAGNVFGQLTGFIQKLNGGLVYEVSGIRADAFRVFNYVQSGNAQGAFSYVLRGNDVLNGSNQVDALQSFGGNDRIFGSGGNDRLFGQKGNDRLDGGAGADLLVGGDGSDLLRGGNDSARDTFEFETRTDSDAGKGNRDIISDFHRNDDFIDLSAVDANADRFGNQKFDYSRQDAKAYSVWWADSGKNLIVRADVNGDARADFEIVLLNAAFVTEDNFRL
jgi:Ca2+-binding RTX toxin-like protein